MGVDTGRAPVRITAELKQPTAQRVDRTACAMNSACRPVGHDPAPLRSSSVTQRFTNEPPFVCAPVAWHSLAEEGGSQTKARRQRLLYDSLALALNTVYATPGISERVCGFVQEAAVGFLS
ncbi:hypothetical protein SKAU_G00203260 [Synaphobranchus kaupii]|uniref:Uncharacterized protein n=1 Tax=Synaphobranchus kaupii TaxID=118154 RepID=A0A9Q1IWB0_SYNKA|nr:hypothetical protein SKAU_G00203260 [Synaphobranchus kaupii]